jgi:hypothetical protein
MRTASKNISGGFSMIEVIMAVLILGLGLLGIGAIMPVVAKQQRIGADQTQGVIAARSGLQVVLGNARVDDAFWRRWVTTLPPGTNASVPGASASNPDNWQNLIPEDGSWKVLGINDQTNTIALGRSGGRTLPNNNPQVFTEERSIEIPMSDRLFPQASSGAAEPQFVWDVAVRRMGRRDLGANPIVLEPGWDRVQVALIARRVDSRISRPRGSSLYLLLSDPTLATTDRRWPVAKVPGNGEPTLDGRYDGAQSYSEPVRLNATFSPDSTWPRDRIVLDPASAQGLTGTLSADVVSRQVIVAGQTLIDNLGNVYTVLGQDTRVTDTNAVRVSPPVAPGVDATDNNNTQSLRSVLVTLQAPASVVVQTVTP